MAESVACCDSGPGRSLLHPDNPFIETVTIIARNRRPRRCSAQKPFTRSHEGAARRLPHGAICGLFGEAPGRIHVHELTRMGAMRLHSLESRLFACFLAFGGMLALGAVAQAQSDQERFFGGGPRYGTTYSPYSSSYSPYSSSASPIPKTTVSFDASYARGTIVINTSERRLYYVLGGGQALRYGIGVGRVGFTWAGVTKVSAKREWPDWTPPAEMIRRRPELPRHMKGGIDNPLGARAMYLGSSLYRIHGSNEPETIGQAVSSGCFRMTNEDVVDLYGRVSIGTTVVVLR
jgi:lipoprotein-anchoring transpeptidase ErfK/SrfK